MDYIEKIIKCCKEAINLIKDSREYFIILLLLVLFCWTHYWTYCDEKGPLKDKTSQINTIKTQIKQKDKNIDELKERIKNLENTNENLKQTIDNLKQQIHEKTLNYIKVYKGKEDVVDILCNYAKEVDKSIANPSVYSK